MFSITSLATIVNPTFRIKTLLQSGSSRSRTEGFLVASKASEREVRNTWIWVSKVELYIARPALAASSLQVGDSDG